MSNLCRGIRIGHPALANDQRRGMDDDHKKPAAERDSGPKTKPCLVCKAPFLSEWAGERICRRCKSSAAWRSGVIKSR
jgi:hypothetical protein